MFVGDREFGVRDFFKLVLLGVLLLAVGSCGPAARIQVDLAQTQARPNILFILTDDMDVGSLAEMPRLQSLLTQKGTTFDRAFVTTALCCPSRTTTLRSQHAHSHGIWTTRSPEGGFARFRELGYERSTVATWLDQAGYHTGYMGKYQNEYGSFTNPTTHIPQGWDRWVGYQGGPGEQRRRGAFKVNDQGKIVEVDADVVHDTDYLALKAEAYIRNRQAGKPWFLAVGTNAPHEPAEASKRNDGTYAGRDMPRTPAFNEADMSDKASIWQDNPLLDEECPPDYESVSGFQCLRESDEVWRDRMESLQDVDDMVGRLVAALDDKGFLQNTYIVFTSDNGFAMYDNRIFSKGAPYERAHEVPFIVKGPGVPAGRVDDRLVANIDLAPTFADWAGVRTPRFVEGRSLVPLLRDPGAAWRDRLLYEHRLGNHVYDAVRTGTDEVYIEYPRTNETEYYDLTEDPYQLEAKAISPPELEAQLQRFKDCSGEACREVDGGP